MKLSATTHDELQQFFRQHLSDAELRLPPITVHAGLLAKLLLKANGMGAITFGRHVFVRPALVKKDEEGRASIPGWLLAHEAAHVLQYEQRGYLRFFRDYLGGYLRGLLKGKRWSAQGHRAAYMSIAEELSAHQAEHAYRELKRPKIT
jgi:tRNA-dihydrouridine synthase